MPTKNPVSLVSGPRVSQCRMVVSSRHEGQAGVEVAHVVAKTKQTYLAAHDRRIAARQGKKRALIAVVPETR